MWGGKRLGVVAGFDRDLSLWILSVILCSCTVFGGCSSARIYELQDGLRLPQSPVAPDMFLPRRFSCLWAVQHGPVADATERAPRRPNPNLIKIQLIRWCESRGGGTGRGAGVGDGRASSGQPGLHGHQHGAEVNGGGHCQDEKRWQGGAGDYSGLHAWLPLHEHEFSERKGV